VGIVRISSAVVDGLSCRVAPTNPLLSARSKEEARWRRAFATR
jgi:hypothetical protein